MPLNRQSPSNMRPPRLFSQPLVREIAVVMAVKLVLLTALWFAFFRNPDSDGPLGPEQVARVIAGESGVAHGRHTAQP